MPTPICAADVGLTERRVDQLAEHLEQQLFGAGAGEVGRTKLLAVAQHTMCTTFVPPTCRGHGAMV